MKTILFTFAVHLTAGCLLAEGEKVLPTEAKEALQTVVDKKDASELFEAAKVLTGVKVASFEVREAAVKRLLDSENEEVALLGVTGKGECLRILAQKGNSGTLLT